MWNRPVTPMISAKLTSRAPVTLPRTSPCIKRSRNSVMFLLPPPCEKAPRDAPGASRHGLSHNGEVAAADVERRQLLGERRRAGGGHFEQAHRPRSWRVGLGAKGDRAGGVARAIQAHERRFLFEGRLQLGGLVRVAALGQHPRDQLPEKE